MCTNIGVFIDFLKAQTIYTYAEFIIKFVKNYTENPESI